MSGVSILEGQGLVVSLMSGVSSQGSVWVSGVSILEGQESVLG